MSPVRVKANGVLLEFDSARVDSGFAILEWLDKRFPPIVEPWREQRWRELQARMKDAARASR